MKKLALLFACFALLVAAVPMSAHHSAAAFDTQKNVNITGTVVAYKYTNPHIYLTLEVKKDDGTTQRMEVEAGAASVLNPLGFTKEALKIGELVTVSGNPSRREPDKLMLGKDLTRRDGSYLPLNIASKSIYDTKNATATSIAGTWFSPMSQFGGYMGAAGRWERTAKGQAAPRLSATETTQKDCIPIGVPAVMFYPVANKITVQKDRVILDVDWMDSTRTVYLDGRKHPPASETFLHGHSVGRWEDKVLVVETTNFKEHPMGLSTSVPSSTQKKVTERFELSPDGKQLLYSGTVEDPVILAKPGTWTGRWEYRPNMPLSDQKCDVELARKFLTN